MRCDGFENIGKNSSYLRLYPSSVIFRIREEFGVTSPLVALFVCFFFFLIKFKFGFRRGFNGLLVEGRFCAEGSTFALFCTSGVEVFKAGTEDGTKSILQSVQV